MLKNCLLALALAGASVFTIRADTNIVENFASNPLQNGWMIFGATNLFQWDSTNQNLRVTWDSSQPNSYFCHPLGTTVTRGDDFSMSFDLSLSDIGVGIHSQLSNDFEIALGFFNFADATQTNFLRSTATNSPNLAEWDYFWDSGYGATVWPAFIDTNSNFNYNGSTDYAVYSLTLGDTYHVTLAFNAADQLAVATLTNAEQTSGVYISQAFTNFLTDFRLDTFSISSYSDAGQDPLYAGSVLAHGTVANLVVAAPSPPVQNITGALPNGRWQVQFTGRAEWIYTLERTTGFTSWTNVTSLTNSSPGPVVLSDLPPAGAHAFYRVQANLP